MFDALEARRLFAASATLTDGVLRIAGTNESDRISIDFGFTLQQAADAITGAVALNGQYVVSVNDVNLGTFDSGDVTRINVFGLGGNDKMTGPKDPDTLTNFTVKQGENGSYVVTRPAGSDSGGGVTLDPAPLTVPLYVEGGSGNDFIQGSSGNDTLKGGRGNDVIRGGAGNDYVDGGRGDDSVFMHDGIEGGLGGPGVPAAAGTGDVIVSQAGRDWISRDQLDALRFDRITRRTNVVYDAYDTVIVGPIVSTLLV